MPGDFSRTLFDPTKSYSGVLMQQGRVQLDADWNEQLALQLHRTTAETIDVIGPCGAPKEGDGFLVTPLPDDLLIAPGRFYADGLLCELGATPMPITFPQGSNNQVVVPNLLLDGRLLTAGQWVEISAAQMPAPSTAQITFADSNSLILTVNADISSYQNAGAAFLRRMITYATQPNFPEPDFTLTSPPTSPITSPPGSPVNLPDGTYLVYLDAWQREVNALEDPRIRENALGGPDTTERLQTVWQVKLLPVATQTSPPSSPLSSPISSPPSSPLDCATDFQEWDQLVAPMTGMVNAQTVPPSASQDVCALPPTAGYQSLENQLYRIEIFQGGRTAAQSTFVWSRDNGSVESSISQVDNFDVYLHDLGKDDVLGFADGQWVEVVDRDDELQGTPRFLAEITGQPDPTNNKVTLSVSAAAYTGRTGLRLRRWDMSGAAVTTTGIPITSGWIDIEAGIQVQFLDGTFAPRSYWQIPARTGTGEIEWPSFDVPNLHPIQQPPLGVKHHYCKLALLEVVGGMWAVTDCRKRFPSLTSICADDVCYNGQCALPGVITVQDAIDQLCQGIDLRDHNKHLHGWGIVCGLEVVCGPDDPYGPRQHVTVRAGRAIDCTGEQIVIAADQPVNAIDLLTASPPNYTVPDGDYCLILDPTVPGQFRFVNYDPSWGKFKSLLTDSLLMDFYNDCLLNLKDFFNQQFKPQPGSTDLVSPAQKRFTTIVINLFLAQYSSPDIGSYVFLSQTEDSILQDFYNGIRGILQSKTYCAQFDQARTFAYPPSLAALGINTIFGKSQLSFTPTAVKTRMRVDPTGSRAYTVGTDSLIDVYDLQNQQMGAELTFPTPGAVVQDVAFSPDGTQLYVIANLNNTDTAFTTATVNGMTHTWSGTIVVCNKIFTTLATWTSLANSKTMAVAVAADGLYLFDPASLSATPTPTYAFAAFGHLVVDQGSNQAFATACSTGANSNGVVDHFDEVVRVNLADTTVPQFVYALSQLTGSASGNDTDDIAVVPASQLPGQPATGQLFVSWNMQFEADKLLTTFPSTGTSSAPLGNTVDLGESTSISMAYNQVTNFLMITFEDSYRVKLFKPGNGMLEIYRHPTQVQPIAIAFRNLASGASTVYVWNDISNTITVIPAAEITSANAWPLNDLVQYRVNVIDAFLDLIGGFAQYLKDCFCDHLLVQCPECDGDDQLYLACISIRNNEIYKVCNFSKRKYVKSFPTVGYWLSLIPIVPALHWIFEKICCAALPEHFGTFNAPQPSGSVAANPSAGFYKTRFPAKTVRSTLNLFQTGNVTSAFNSGLGKLKGGLPIAGAFAAHPKIPRAVTPFAQIASTGVMGQTVTTAKAKLAAANITVDRVVPYDRTQLASNLTHYAEVPADLRPGTTVTLVADERNVVQYYTLSSLPVEQEALNSALSQLADLQTALAHIQATNAKELAARDLLIQNLQTQVQRISSVVRLPG
jgi:hypothetical protein